MLNFKLKPTHNRQLTLSLKHPHTFEQDVRRRRLKLFFRRRECEREDLNFAAVRKNIIIVKSIFITAMRPIYITTEYVRSRLYYCTSVVRSCCISKAVM